MKTILEEIQQKNPFLKAQFLRELFSLVEGQSVTVYDLEYNPTQKILRVFICPLEFAEQSKNEGITLEKCIVVDKALSPFLENSSELPSEVVLEVSSPGLERELKYPLHWPRSVNRKIKIKYGTGKLERENLENKLENKKEKKWQQAVVSLQEVLYDENKNEIVSIQVLNEKGIQENIPLENIKKAKWHFEF